MSLCLCLKLFIEIPIAGDHYSREGLGKEETSAGILFYFLLLCVWAWMRTK